MAVKPVGSPAFSTAAWSLPADVFRRATLALTMILGSALILLAMVLLWRRMAGALAQPLSPGLALGTGLLFAIWAGGLRLMLLCTEAAWLRERMRRAAWVDISIVTVLVGLLLWVPGMRFWAIALFWLPVLGEETAAWLVARRPSVVRGLRFRSQVPAPAAEPRPLEPVPREHLVAPLADEPFAEPETLDGLVQQLTRTQTAAEDTLEGLARAVLIAGQRTAYVHVAFCPPFAAMPTLEFEQTDGPDARIKVGQLLPYGARFDVRTDEPGPACVSVEFVVKLESRSQKSEGGQESA